MLHRMETARKAILLLVSLPAALLLQGLLGKLLMQYSSWAFPGEVTGIGMFGAGIANPLFFGAYFLPFYLQINNN